MLEIPEAKLRVLLLAALLLALGAAPAPAVASSGSLPSTTLQGVVFEGFRVGETEFEVRAVRAEVDWNDRIARMQSIEIFFDSAERGPVRVRSDVGIVDLDREDFELLGNVEGSTSLGERFFTDRIRYDRSSNSLRGRGEVRVERDGLLLVGDGLNVDLATQQLRFTGRVKVRAGGR